MGWQVVGRWEASVVQDAREIEREVLAWFSRLGIPYAFERGEMKYRGYTETASLENISTEQVEKFIELLAVNVLTRS
ncbi:hypothetical protein [Nonomuraea sp. NPDC049750]|uniref:hypothetical protein n=1 Tax=Nonomuraea sp. NPDC049750 TaxID=3154738 RepID=UPI00340138C2